MIRLNYIPAYTIHIQYSIHIHTLVVVVLVVVVVVVVVVGSRYICTVTNLLQPEIFSASSLQASVSGRSTSVCRPHSSLRLHYRTHRSS